MPQMSPINWLSLFLMFIMIFTIFNMMNYYCMSPTPLKTLNNKMTIYTFNWKW